MSCEWHANLDHYLDDELPDPAAAEMEAHLRGCPSCAADALSRLQLKRTTHAVGQRFAPRPEFRLKIEQSIGAAKRPRMRWRWAWNFAGVAALGLILVSTAFWLQHWRGNQALSELADLHVSMLASANPVDVVSSDRHTVKPWFQGKLPFSFNLPELNGGPFQLLGGRVTYFQQRPGAHLLFQVREHRLSVFVFQDRPGLIRFDLGASLRRKLAFNFETWAEGDLRYFVFGDANRTDIHELSELIKRAAQS
jgi:anti-sigma factor RsiW